MTRYGFVDPMTPADWSLWRAHSEAIARQNARRVNAPTSATKAAPPADLTSIPVEAPSSPLPAHRPRITNGVPG